MNRDSSLRDAYSNAYKFAFKPDARWPFGQCLLGFLNLLLSGKLVYFCVHP